MRRRIIEQANDGVCVSEPCEIPTGAKTREPKMYKTVKKEGQPSFLLQPIQKIAIIPTRSSKGEYFYDKTNKTPWGGGIKELKPSKLAFTLAEVLITLAIIGIVAALTIPTLVSKNEKKQLYTQFMKSYNTLSNVMNLASAEHGDPSNWVSYPNDNNVHDVSALIFDKILSKNMKVVKTCKVSNYSECMPFASYKTLDGNLLFGEETLSEMPSESVFIIGADGSSYMIISDIYSGLLDVFFYLDTNGLKGPNVLGRDLHALEFSDSDGKYMLHPADDYTTESYGQTTNSYGKSYNNCDPLSNNESNGFGCAARLLKEGAMNY